METKTINFKKLADEYLAGMYHRESDGLWFANDGAPIRDFVLELSDANVSLDSAYAFTVEALNQLSDYDPKDEDAAYEAIEAIDPDVYTGQLTGWLAESLDHVSWMDEAADEYDAKGSNALMLGQQLAKQHIGRQLVDWIVQNAKN